MTTASDHTVGARLDRLAWSRLHTTILFALGAGWLFDSFEVQIEHDPADIDRAREIASAEDPIPVGILYHNPAVPCYEDLSNAGRVRTAEQTRAGLESELDKFTVWPDEDSQRRRAA